MEINVTNQYNGFLNLPLIQEGVEYIKFAYVSDVTFGNSIDAGNFMKLRLLDCNGQAVVARIFNRKDNSLEEVARAIINKICLITFTGNYYNNKMSLIITSIKPNKEIKPNDFIGKIEDYDNKLELLRQKIDNINYGNFNKFLLGSPRLMEYCNDISGTNFYGKVGENVNMLISILDLEENTFLKNDLEKAKAFTIFALINNQSKSKITNFFFNGSLVKGLVLSGDDERDELVNLVLAISDIERPTTVLNKKIVLAVNAVKEIFRFNAISMAVPKGGYRYVEEKEESSDFYFNF